jgi:hypothetical protein
MNISIRTIILSVEYIHFVHNASIDYCELIYINIYRLESMRNLAMFSIVTVDIRIDYSNKHEQISSYSVVLTTKRDHSN